MNSYDFAVERRPLFLFDPYGPAIPVPKRQALINCETGEVISIIGNRYNLILHADAIDHLHRAIKKDGHSVTARTEVSKGGARIYHKVTFDDVKCHIEGSHDEVKLQVVMMNSYDGFCKFSLIAGAFRIICSNGMILGDTYHKSSQKHSSGLDFNQTMKSLSKTINQFSTVLIPFYKALRDYDISQSEGNIAIDRVAKTIHLPNKYKKLVVEEWNKPRTDVTGVRRDLYGLFNSHTSVLTHQVKKTDVAHRLSSRLVPAFQSIVN